jgi:hypothetical protein
MSRPAGNTLRLLCSLSPPALATLGYHLKEQLGAGLGQGDEAKFVDDQQLDCSHGLLEKTSMKH